MATLLTLQEAIKFNRLDDFIAQSEAEGVSSASEAEFEKTIKRVVKAPPPQGRTSGYRARGGSNGKKTR